LRIIEQGRTDTVDTTSLHVSSIDLVVGGDVFYNQCHMYVGVAKFSGHAVTLRSSPTVFAFTSMPDSTSTRI
jgi:hypothetical protein